MTIDRDTIEKINELHKDGQYWNADALAEDFAILGGERIQLEQFKPNRDSYRAKYATTELDDFVGYCKENDGDASIGVYVDPDSMSSKVIFDLGNAAEPGHCRHTASLQLKKTPELEAILATETKYLSQQDAVLFLQDWQHTFVYASDGEQAMTLTTVLAAIRRIKVESNGATESVVGNHAQSRSALESVGVVNVLPETIRLRAEPYVGLPEMDYDLSVIVNLDGQKPTVRLRLMQRGAMQNAIARSFVEQLRSKMDFANVLIGTLSA